jgi:hypothetical protein
MRGDREKTCRYAFRAMEYAPFEEGRPLLLLLYSLKDRSPKEAVRIIKGLALPGRYDIAARITAILYTIGASKRLFDNAILPYTFQTDTALTGIVGAQEPETERVLSFRLKAERLFAGMRYAGITDDPDAGLAASQDHICAFYLAYALLMRGEYAKACETVIPHIKSGLLKQDLLSIVLVAAEKAQEPLASEARKLFEDYFAISNEIVDLSDIINTGAVYAADTKKQRRMLRDMTPSIFRDGYEKDKTRTVTELLLNEHKRAAPVLERNGCVLQAAESYRLLLAKGHDLEENTPNIIRLFENAGNGEAAKEVKKLPSPPSPRLS